MSVSSHGLPETQERKPSMFLQNLSNNLGKKRAADLTLLENIPCGPIEHKPPADDPHFARLEPYSGIHLSKRVLPYETLQSHFEGRHFLSFSKLYSVVREVPGPGSRGSKYDVPTDGEWITIGIVAERGDIKFTNTSNQSRFGDEDSRKDASKKSKGKDEHGNEEAFGSRPKKYMSIKLVDLGKDSDKKGIRGDQILTMLLFEADEVINANDSSKTYKGGSGGAFEACMKIHEGAVIAILHPKILKPYQRNGQTNYLLAITPTSSQNIAIIGHSRDLGTCAAMKADGKVCGSCCDKRIGEYCEYHIERAIKMKRARRPEFTAGTSGMSRTAAGTTEKSGLLQEERPSATYIIPGHIIGGGPEYINEKVGRERAERQKRKREGKEVEEQLNRLLGKKLDKKAKCVPPIPLPGAKRQAAPSRVVVTPELLASLQKDSKQVILTRARRTTISLE